MTGNLNRILDLLFSVTDRLLRQGFSYRMAEGALLYLDDVRLFRPTADAGTLLQLEEVFDCDSPAVSQLPEELRHLLKKIITRETVLDPEFDFARIESLTASKGFGLDFNPRINGSWFRNLEAWGKGMYPGANLPDATQKDWEANVRHIEKEGFSRRSPVRVTYYGWYDRYVASNTGGSHHAAKVIWQCLRDKIPYRREAAIEKLSVDADAVRELEADYFSFLFLSRGDNRYSYNDTQFRLLMSSLVSRKVRYLKPVLYHQNVNFAFITKAELKGRQALFSKWMAMAAQAGKIIPLPEYLKKPQAYHNKPYLHEIRDIYLGEPFSLRKEKTR